LSTISRSRNHKTSLHSPSKWLKDDTTASTVSLILMEKWRFWFDKGVTTLLEAILGNFVINHQPLPQSQTSLHAASKWLKDGTTASTVASILMEKRRF
jgi:hypothetical protein